MSFMNWIIAALNDIAEWLYDFYLDYYDEPWPLDKVARVAYELSWFFGDLAWDFYYFSEWVYDVWARVQDILSWSNIQSLISDWLAWLESPLSWFRNLWGEVWDEIDSWWPTVWDQIQGWIAFATGGLSDLLVAWDDFWNITWPQWTGNLIELRSLWDTFWTTIFPNLVDFTWLTTWWNGKLLEINGLMDTWVKTLAPFWEGWQEIRDTVLEFFTDPLEWLWARFTDWFLGPEV